MTAWVSFKIGGTKTFYSRELRNSLKQIANRDVLPHIDYHFGFQALQYLIEETLSGQYNKAIIYGLKNDNTEKGIILREYDSKGIVKIVNEPDFNSEKWLEAKDKLIKRIQFNCKRAHKIINVFDPQNPILIRR